MTLRRHPNVGPLGKDLENPAVDAFLAEIAGVCEKHQMSISHEDSGGSFVIMPYNASDAIWLEVAVSKVDPPTQSRNTP